MHNGSSSHRLSVSSLPNISIIHFRVTTGFAFRIYPYRVSVSVLLYMSLSRGDLLSLQWCIIVDDASG